jgi:hypothetical protein
MHIIYWAHSYRASDALLNQHFGMLIEESERIVVNFDPPSDVVNSAKLEQNLRACDGMIAVLTYREGGPSQYILYEIALAMRARKPLLVFMDDRLADGIVPARILQQRFSHRTFFRQVRDQLQAIRVLKTYMGDSPPPRYQPYSTQRSCGLIGYSKRTAHARIVADNVSERGYRVFDLESLDTSNPFHFNSHEELAKLDLVVRNADSRSRRAEYWAGATSSAFVPTVQITLDVDYQFDTTFPTEFQPKSANVAPERPLDVVLAEEVALFEQDFLKAQDDATIERYTRMQFDSSLNDGRYEPETRSQYVEVVMGDQYNVSGQTGAVGPQAHAHDISFQQIWSQASKQIDLPKLATELRQLQEFLRDAASEPDHRVAIGQVEAAAEAAEAGNGPKALEYLKAAGKWTFDTASKVGIGVAIAAAKTHLGF